MREGRKKTFTTGEFAKLCGTTKDTLYHYDRTGLLKPQVIGDNGYRAYAPEQLFEYDMIRVLRLAGSPLKQIGWYKEHYDVPHFLSLIGEQKQALAEKKRELEKMEQMLDHVAEWTAWGMSAPNDQPEMQFQEQESLLVTRLKLGEGEAISSSVARIAEHFALLNRMGVVNRYPLGSIILKEQALAGSELESYYFTPAPDGFRGENVLEKPAGNYAVVFHRGGFDSFSQAYQALLAYIKKQGLLILGDAYVRDVVSYLASQKEEKFIVQISIQVEAPPFPSRIGST